MPRRRTTGGALVLFGRCEEEALILYQPFVEALRFYVAHTPPDDLRTQLGDLAPDLVRLLLELTERLPSRSGGQDPRER